MLVGLTQNVALLVTLAVGLGMLSRWFEDRRLAFRVAAGLLFGLVGVAGMMIPVQFAPGVIFDGRSIILSLAGLFGGFLPGVLAAAICSVYRLHLGGAGAWVGTAVIIEATAVGLALRYLRRRNRRWERWDRLLLAGVFVHAVMLGLQLFLPGQMGWEAVQRVGLVVLFGYPLAFLLTAQVFLDRERRQKDVRALLESEERYRNLFENNHAVMLLVDPASSAIADANPAAERFYGWDRRQLKAMSIHDINAAETEEITREIEAARQAKRNYFVFQHRLANGDVRDVEVYSGSITFAGRELLYSMVHDITERRQAEEALSERERYLRTILQTTADGFWVVDATGRVVDVNEAYCAMTGYTREELIGMAIGDLDADEPEEDTRARIRRIAVRGSELFEARHRRKDGSVFPIEVSSTYLADHGGQFVCFGRDLTERRKRDERINLLGRMVDAAPASITVHDAEGRFLFANAATLALHGYESMEAFLQVNLHELDVPESEERIAARMHQIAEKGEAQFEVSHYRKDGTSFPMEILAKQIEWNGRPAFLSIASDITARKQAEQALRENEAFLAAMVACSPVALYSIGVDGNVQTWNASAERVFGWEAEEILGRPLPIVPADQHEAFAALRHDVAEGRSFTGLEVIRSRKDGSRMTGRLSAAPIRDDSGQVIGIMGAMEDITESKRLEEQFRQAQKMESVGRLAGGVAHDFNNMLNVILGHTQLALEDLGDDGPLRGSLEEVERAARRSADLTRQLLAFARRQTIEPKTLDLNDTITSMLKMLGRLIGEDIDLLWKPGYEVDPIHIDPAQIDQLLANLVVNARDAIGHGQGKVTIETGTADFDEEYCASHAGFEPGHYVLLAVSDDGCGMDRETRANIFEPFFTTKAVGEGTGLGLATVYGIVKQNSGFINVYSEPGLGTTFRIYLPPRDKTAIGVLEGPAGEVPRAKGEETVLLVEDEASLLALISRMLKRLGYHVLTAATPSEALRVARKHPGEVHLLITDVVMPEMNGRELTRELALSYPGMKCLYMSGYTANVIAHHGVLDEGVHFIQKPFSAELLGNKVRETLES